MLVISYRIVSVSLSLCLTKNEESVRCSADICIVGIGIGAVVFKRLALYGVVVALLV